MSGASITDVNEFELLYPRYDSFFNLTVKNKNLPKGIYDVTVEAEMGNYPKHEIVISFISDACLKVFAGKTGTTYEVFDGDSFKLGQDYTTTLSEPKGALNCAFSLANTIPTTSKKD